MDCKVITVEQGSDEWLDLRRCRITASRLGDVCAKPDTKRYRQYRKEIVLELLGNTNVEESPEWARHGRENEPRALAGYEWKTGIDVAHDLFLISKQYDWLACSPDFLHLPDYDQGGEVKCRALYKNYRQFRALAEEHEGNYRAAPASDRRQIQGAMWVTGLDWWWYVNYYIGDDLEGSMTQKIHRVRIPRDQRMIDAMEERCLKFMHECYEMAGLHRPPDPTTLQ